MATNRSFNSMLNEYLHYDLLKEEAIKRDYLLTNVEKDQNWKGGTLVVPFRGGRASSFSYGSLTAATDVAEDTYVRGNISNYKEIWGTMKFNARDLSEHGSLAGQASGVVNEQSFLKILPDTLDDFMQRQKEVVSVNLLTGTHFATLTSNGTAGGLMVVDHPERFEIDQKVVVDDDNSAPVTGYVKRTGGIDINTKTIHLVTARGGSTDVDLSAYTTDQSARVYEPGAETAANAFTPLKSQLLPASLGGADTLFGQTKADYPYLQATNHDGSAITDSNIDTEVFDAWTENQKIGKGKATDAVMDYTNLGRFMKQLDNKSGPFRHVETKADKFGWTEISIIGVNGELKIVGVHEMDTSEIYFVDWRGLKLHSNGMFRIQEDPEGKKFFPIRNTTGYEYLVDVVFYGELAVNRPSYMGAMYGIT